MWPLIVPECEPGELYFLVLPLTAHEELVIGKFVGDCYCIGVEITVYFSYNGVLTIYFFGVEYTCEWLGLLIEIDDWIVIIKS